MKKKMSGLIITTYGHMGLDHDSSQWDNPRTVNRACEARDSMRLKSEEPEVC